MPEEFSEWACPLLPVVKEGGPEGGRPRTAHRTVLKGIWFVLVTGCRWKEAPQKMGCCGEAARTRLQSGERAGIWSQLHRDPVGIRKRCLELLLLPPPSSPRSKTSI